VLGLVGYKIAEPASTAMGLLIDKATSVFWIDTTKGLPIFIQNMVTEWIYWPLQDSRRLWEIPNKLGDLSLEECTLFISYFELILRSNNCIV
jgi:hypothetical protein